MHPSVTSLPADICFNCTHHELFMCLENIINGSPLPSNVIDDVNPYKYLPSNLPGGLWFLINSDMSKAATHGLWKSKEESCEVHSSSTIIGWKATLEYYDGQEPHEHKTNWVMEVFSITLKKLTENSVHKEESLLCKVFQSSEQSVNCEKQKEVPQAGIVIEDAAISGSIDKTKVNKDDRTRALAVTERTSDLQVESPLEMAHFMDGDYLELGDLDNPVSSSSSSCNSSLQSVSSDEYFDSSAFLRELECGTGIILEKRNTSLNFEVSGQAKANEMVALPATLATGNSRDLGNKNPARSQKREHEDESPSTKASNPPASCSSHRTGKERGNKGSAGRMKRLKRKYFCFLPF